MDDFAISSAQTAGIANTKAGNDVRALAMKAAFERQMSGMVQESVDVQKQQTAAQVNNGSRGSRLDIYA